MKRGVFNAAAGFLNQLLIMVIGILLPRYFLLTYGPEIHGLTTSITQIFTYFALFEAGVGAASLQALYAPVAKNDYASASGIIAATSKYYKKTSLVYFAGVILFSVIYPFVTASSISNLTVSLLILIQGLAGVLSYLLYAKYKVLLEAEGKDYIVLSAQAFVGVFTNLFKIILMILGFDIILVQATFLFFSILQFIFILIYIRKKYKWIDHKATPNHQAIAQKSSVLVHQISSLVFNNTDILILTIFCGFTVTSIYLMYSLVFGLFNSLVITAATSVSFALGQSYNSDKHRFNSIFNCYETYFNVLVYSMYGVAFIFVLPFMRLYTAGVEIDYIDQVLPVLFLSLSLLSASRIPTNIVINCAGHFRQTQIRSLVESGINIIVSIAAVKAFGIYGVLVGTIAALLYRSNDIILYTSRHLLHRSPWPSYRRTLLNLALMLLMIFVSSKIALSLNGYMEIALYGIIYFIIAFTVMFCISSIADREAFKALKVSVGMLLPGKKRA